MKLGTKSILFGAHQFIIHPICVFFAWWKLYGFPSDPRLWIAFVIHDWGYWECPNMDGEEGELHPWWAAEKMGYWFGQKWHEFCLYHSRFLAKRHGVGFSRLCVADKMSMWIEPPWLYLPRVMLSGEIKEYMGHAHIRHKKEGISTETRTLWFTSVRKFGRYWAYRHRDLRPDETTKLPD